MLNKSEIRFSIIFILIVLLELISGSYEALKSVHLVSKPAIVISLLAFFIMRNKHLNISIRRFVILGLLFSVLGDVLLLFVDRSPHFFMLGLIAFLIAHIMYILSFLKQRNKTKRPIWFIILMLIYAVGLFSLLKNHLGEMLVPVIIYMLVILSMATSAYLRHSEKNALSYKFVFVGALLFMLSDSILALNKFYQELPFSHICIMVTYALAQYFIILGVLKLKPTS